MREIKHLEPGPLLRSTTRVPNTVGRPKRASATWWRGENTQFTPALYDMDRGDAIQEYILKGSVPESPVIEPETVVTAFGSCFAQHIGKWLSERNYNIATKGNAYVIVCGEGLVNTFAIRGQFEWALKNRQPAGEFWHGFDATAFGYDEAVRQETRDLFLKTDVFIVTFGLSEIWYDEPTGDVFWRAVPAAKFDPKRHKFRVSSVAENTENIRAIYHLIREANPAAKIIFTLSPIPLAATFRDVSCLVANSVSKAILRASIDAIVSEFHQEGHLFYWPSYEIVTEAFPNRWNLDRRHIKREVLDYIMMAFEKAWCVKPPTDDEMTKSLMAARIADGAIPPKFIRAAKKGDQAAVDAYLAAFRKQKRVELADFAQQWWEMVRGDEEERQVAAE
jgi:hypothetical protein